MNEASKIGIDTHPSRDSALWVVVAFLVLALPVLFWLPSDQGRTTAERIWAGLLVLMLVYDIATLRVPNLLVYTAMLFAFGSIAVVDSGRLLSSLGGAAALLAGMYIVAVIGRGAMGMADVKVSAFIGAILGFQGGAMSVVFGLATAGAFAGVVLLLHLRGRKDVAPLTPFLAGSAIVCMVILGSVFSSGS